MGGRRVERVVVEPAESAPEPTRKLDEIDFSKGEGYLLNGVLTDADGKAIKKGEADPASIPMGEARQDVTE